MTYTGRPKNSRPNSQMQNVTDGGDRGSRGQNKGHEGACTTFDRRTWCHE